MKTEFTITKKQIEIIYEATATENQEQLKEWFPKAFEKELEVGKWYNYNGCLLNYVKEKKGIIKAYGFFYGEFDENHCNCGTSYDKWDLANEEEVSTALIAESKKRGYNKENTINLDSEYTDNTFRGYYYNKHDNKLYSAERYCGGMTLFDNGIWATKIETITKEEAEKMLNKKII